MAKSKIMVSISDAALNGVDSRGTNRSAVISRDLERLYHLQQEVLQDCKFTEAEAQMLCNKLRSYKGYVGLIMHEIPDTEEMLRKKLDGSDIEAFTIGLAVTDAVERFARCGDLKKAFLIR